MKLVHLLDVKSLEAVKSVVEQKLEKTNDFKQSLRLNRTIYGLENKIIQTMKC